MLLLKANLPSTEPVTADDIQEILKSMKPVCGRCTDNVAKSAG